MDPLERLICDWGERPRAPGRRDFSAFSSGATFGSVGQRLLEFFLGEADGAAILARSRARCSSRVSFYITTMWILPQSDSGRFDYENGRDLVVVCRVRSRVGSTSKAPGIGGIREKIIGAHVRRCCSGEADIAVCFE